MKGFAERILDIKDDCVRCWADEFSDIFPQQKNGFLAEEEMKRRGNPPHSKRGRCRLSITHLDSKGESEK